MPKLNLKQALAIKDSSNQIIKLKTSFVEWTKPSASVPVITITSGSGYSGSVYTSTVAGQWYADDVAISGEIGTTYVPSYTEEGKAIRCGDSNVIEMWVPTDITTENLTVWTADGQQVSSGKVTKWFSKTNSYELTQGSSAYQPTVGSINNQVCSVWPSSKNGCLLESSSDLSSYYAMSVMQYLDGVNNTFYAKDYVGLFSANNDMLGRIMINASGELFIGNNSWAPNSGNLLKVNTTDASKVLPLPLSIVEFEASSRRSGRPRLGNETFNTSERGWSGPVCLFAVCPEIPIQAEKNKLQGYAAHKYGISGSLPNGHPYKIQAPRIQ